ncbi:MAG: hypothetical protein HQK79_10930 [Desulfobacterales bacterium]|nr:hypothetical protein [Desulfobacterales bacterium]MBF0395815.1 hypothetical protein [Desulfobacterales bacterium]
MKLLNNILNPFIRKEKPIIEARIKVLRFRKFLENARTLMDLIEDGKEKLKEEYILDRSYISSLVDKVIENVRMLVFNACMLVPEGGEILYKEFDEHKILAQKDILNIISEKSISPKDKNESEEPEYRLLRNAVTWMIGPFSKLRPTVMDFIKQTFDHVIFGLSKFVYPQGIVSQLDLNKSGNDYHLDIIQLEENIILKNRKKLAINDIQCRPLGFMLMDNEKSMNIDTKSLSNQKNWFAAVSRDYLSLSTKNPQNIILLDAQLSGFVDSDFIFIFANKSITLENLLPKGFRVEKTNLGTMAWNYDTPKNIMENHLAYLSQKILKLYN